ncbi:MAG TPA: glycosyltransferase family 39 protein [Anaerolineales bacterium]|nr:glycosyltransferase family 39 protein [Anaerolineales bacterium]
MRDFLKRYHIWFAYLLALAGFAFFVMQAWEYAQTLPSLVWDESMYLYKGLLFAEGRYQPFQDYGPWTNQMPVAFLLPGYIQSWYGPGVEVARIYAVAVGFLALLGIWATVRRSSNAWWAAGAVAVVVSNPGIMQVFSQSFSQTLVTMFFAWMLFFSLGERRQNWELGLAGFLAGLAVMSRLNVLPVLPLLIIYVFWRYDDRAGRFALIGGLIPVVYFHVTYWPEILKIWAYWIPPELFPPIADFRSPWREIFLPDDFSWLPVSGWWDNKTHLAWVGIQSFWEAIRANFVVFFGFLATLLLYPWRTKYQRIYSDQQKHKEVLFLLVTFLTLFAVHLWAANGRSCQFVCFPGYVLFFFVFGLVLVPLSAENWQVEMPVWKQVLAVVLIFALLMMLEVNMDFPYERFRFDLIKNTFDLDIPRFKDWKFQEGTAKVFQFLENKFDYDHYPLRRYILYDPAMETIVRWVKIVLVVGAVIPLAYSLANIRRRRDKINFGFFALMFTLAIGIVFGYGRLFGKPMRMETCETSIIADYEQTGEELSAFLSDGDQVYYRVKPNMLLLELPEVDVYPPQLNFMYTFVDDRTANPDTLEKFVWWNPVLMEEWLAEADYILVENRFFDAEWQQRVDDGQLEQVFVSSPFEGCRGDDTRVVVLRPVEVSGE